MNLEEVSVNEYAAELVEGMIDQSEELKIDCIELDNGTMVIDCGVNVTGSYEAGAIFTEACMGGLATATISYATFEDLSLPAINVQTNHPAIACLGAQKAGWQISVEKFFALGSGPARALALKPKKTYEKIDYKDDSEVGVIALETRTIPNEDVADFIADACGIESEDLYILVAPTASLVGSVQIAGRIVENGIFKLSEGLHYDVKRVKYGAGVSPIAPVYPDDTRAMGITNDMPMYGGRTFYAIEPEEGDNLEEITKKIPSSSSRDYGKPFFDIFKDAGYDFYKIDPGIFAPAEVMINDLKTGKVYRAGKVNVEVLKQSIGLQDLGI